MGYIRLSGGPVSHRRHASLAHPISSAELAAQARAGRGKYTPTEQGPVVVKSVPGRKSGGGGLFGGIKVPTVNIPGRTGSPSRPGADSPLNLFGSGRRPGTLPAGFGGRPGANLPGQSGGSYGTTTAPPPGSSWGGGGGTTWGGGEWSDSQLDQLQPFPGGGGGTAVPAPASTLPGGGGGDAWGQPLTLDPGELPDEEGTSPKTETAVVAPKKSGGGAGIAILGAAYLAFKLFL